MKRQYRLIKLRIETVQNLKRLMAQAGTANLNDLIMEMIRITDAHRLNLKEVGWRGNFGANMSEVRINAGKHK